MTMVADCHPAIESSGRIIVADVDFTITRIWDLSSRHALLVTGTLASGEINQGAVLRNSTTGGAVGVRGLELHAHRGQEHTLIVDRDNREHVLIGHRLVTGTTTDPVTSR
ncbi:hypothetical protein ABIA39_008955 [Nocardia sp. GAS34]|uniref:hypothetical protein n=1 Tax=unclassified Nocardia TaxID=2637762 RepID=UPI003D25900E